MNGSRNFISKGMDAKEKETLKSMDIYLTRKEIEFRTNQALGKKNNENSVKRYETMKQAKEALARRLDLNNAVVGDSNALKRQAQEEKPQISPVMPELVEKYKNGTIGLSTNDMVADSEAILEKDPLFMNTENDKKALRDIRKDLETYSLFGGSGSPEHKRMMKALDEYEEKMYPANPFTAREDKRQALLKLAEAVTDYRNAKRIEIGAPLDNEDPDFSNSNAGTRFRAATKLGNFAKDLLSEYDLLAQSEPDTIRKLADKKQRDISAANAEKVRDAEAAEKAPEKKGYTTYADWCRRYPISSDDYAEAEDDIEVLELNDENSKKEMIAGDQGEIVPEKLAEFEKTLLKGSYNYVLNVAEFYNPDKTHGDLFDTLTIKLSDLKRLSKSKKELDENGIDEEKWNTAIANDLNEIKELLFDGDNYAQVAFGAENYTEKARTLGKTDVADAHKQFIDILNTLNGSFNAGIDVDTLEKKYEDFKVRKNAEAEAKAKEEELKAKAEAEAKAKEEELKAKAEAEAKAKAEEPKPEPVKAEEPKQEIKQEPIAEQPAVEEEEIVITVSDKEPEKFSQTVADARKEIIASVQKIKSANDINAAETEQIRHGMSRVVAASILYSSGADKLPEKSFQKKLNTMSNNLAGKNSAFESTVGYYLKGDKLDELKTDALSLNGNGLKRTYLLEMNKSAKRENNVPQKDNVIKNDNTNEKTKDNVKKNG